MYRGEALDARFYIFPSAGPGWEWKNLKQGQLLAYFYKYDARGLTGIGVDEAWLAQAEGLMMCLWTGGNEADNRMWGYAPVTVIK